MNKKLLLLAAITLTLVLVSCSNNNEQLATQPTYVNLSVDELREMQQTQDMLLIDTHIPQQEHIARTDSFIPYNQILEKTKGLPKDKPIVIYCRSGSMSEQAATALAEEGFSNVYNVLGGTNAWRAKGYEFGPLLNTQSTGSTGAGDVKIELTPHKVVDKILQIDITVNTHSVDLTPFDLEEITTLMIGEQTFKPLEAPSLSGHHASGTLAFGIENEIESFTVIIEGIPNVEERIFVWN